MPGANSAGGTGDPEATFEPGLSVAILLVGPGWQPLPGPSRAYPAMPLQRLGTTAFVGNRLGQGLTRSDLDASCRARRWHASEPMDNSNREP